ncbi:OsmC family protein [Halobacillus rhizosphaerae]|uniref:OsmC family protein n=1 Tax=Halobacillus rhizosphaerae TaxID=3064889 RepID=UPI00398BB64E
MDFYLKENGVRTSFEYGQLNISGDENEGFRPYQLMVASIAGCSIGVFRKILNKQRVKIEDLKVTADIDRNPDKANRIEKIRLHYVVKGYHLNPDKLLKNLDVSRSNCSMVQSVQDSIEVEETLECIELSK